MIAQLFFQKQYKTIIMRHWSFIFILSVLILASCTKEEGTGGTAVVKGKVVMKLCSDDFSRIYAEFPVEDEEVFIMYGDDDFFSDETDTHYDGSFRFSSLRKGTYKVYAYSDDISGESQSGKVPIIQSVEIKSNGDEVEAPVIEIYNQVSNYEGSSTIEGKLFAYDYNSELTILKDSFYVRNEYVYIARSGDNYYFDRQRTFYDGSFVFQSLPILCDTCYYEIYAFSKDLSGQDPQGEIPVFIRQELRQNNQHIILDRLDIIK